MPVKDTADKYAALRSQSTFSRKKSVNEKFSDMIFGKSTEETAFAAQVDAHLQRTNNSTKYGRGRLGEAYLPMKKYGDTNDLFGAKIYLPTDSTFQDYNVLIDTATDLFAMQGWRCASEESCKPKDYDSWNIYPAA